jgi:hypothetical protein
VERPAQYKRVGPGMWPGAAPLPRG